MHQSEIRLIGFDRILNSHILKSPFFLFLLNTTKLRISTISSFQMHQPTYTVSLGALCLGMCALIHKWGLCYNSLDSKPLYISRHIFAIYVLCYFLYKQKKNQVQSLLPSLICSQKGSVTAPLLPQCTADLEEASPGSPFLLQE